MDKEIYLTLCSNAKETVPKMSHYEKCNLVDELDSRWYADWCEREGSAEELTAYLFSLLTQE